MKSPVPCVLYTEDAALARLASAYLESVVDLDCVTDPGNLRIQMRQKKAALLLMDLRAPEAGSLLPETMTSWPRSLIVALGTPLSEPLREAREAGVYAAEDLEIDGWELNALVVRATEQVRLTESVRLLEERIETSSAALQGDRARTHPEPAQPLRNSLPPLRNFDDIEAMLNRIMDGIAGAAFVLRAGIFARTGTDATYRLRAGLACLDETKHVEFAHETPLPRWLEMNAHLVSRSELGNIEDLDNRMMLERALNAMGAELIVPLQGRQQLLGWLFMGRRATGARFDSVDLQDITVFADHVCTALENAVLYEEIARQKTFAETLLHSIPTGIVAVGEDGRIEWFNDAAEKITGKARDEVMRAQAEVLGSRVADLLRRTLKGESVPDASEWQMPLTGRYLSLQAERLMDNDVCSGVIGFVHDTTTERILAEKRAKLERDTFWTELAAAMSHEIRNPMVAVSTFVQILPEKYSDPEFRDEFSKLVTKEIQRVNGIIDQIESFAHPRPLSFSSVDLRTLLEQARDAALAEWGASRNGQVKTSVARDLPPVYGDRPALLECFTHLITNAAEAGGDRKSATISLSAKRASGEEGEENVVVTIANNGTVIPREIRENLFSPFCTTKARGLGLGLPISKRTVADHHGQIRLHSSAKGTNVTVMLPVDHHAEKEDQ